MKTNNHFKIKLTVFVVLLCLVGCKQNYDTPETIAEKYLMELSSDLSEFGFYNARKHDSRNFALIKNEQSDSIISGGEIPSTSELFNKYFQETKMFHRWELKEKSYNTINLYKVFDLTDRTDSIMLDTYMSIESHTLTKIVRRMNAATFLEMENVPFCTLTYSIDPMHLDFKGDVYNTAEVGVIKHPEYGYKIVSFTWKY